MARRNPPPHRPRVVRLGAAAVAGGLASGLGAGVLVAPGGALGPPSVRAEPAPDLARARELYRSAEAAMKDGRYDDAARDYGAAYELSADPALFYKIGHASERAGKCDVALPYYARYLREGKPTEQFTALTRERIAACSGDRAGSGGAAGSAASTGAAASEHGTASAEGPASAGPAAGSGSAAALIPPTREKIAWLMGGGAIALVTLGGVLAYAASSSENDVRDLYAGFAGQPPMFDAQTRKRYDDLVDQGRRYQHLSWAAFGLAGAAAVGVAVLFTVGRHDEPAPSPAPTVTPLGAGVSVRF